MGIKITQKGDFHHIEKFLKRAKNGDFFKHLETYCEMGVAALAAATPIESGLTSASWTYYINDDPADFSIHWYNTNDKDGYFNVAMGLQYGHGTRNGGWVQGMDYINPAIKPVFDKIIESVWREIQSP